MANESHKNDNNWGTSDRIDSPFVDSGLSLESILAEVKGTQLAEGVRHTPTHILEAEAERILREASEQVPIYAHIKRESEQQSAAPVAQKPQLPTEFEIEAKPDPRLEPELEFEPVPELEPEPEPIPEFMLEPELEPAPVSETTHSTLDTIPPAQRQDVPIDESPEAAAERLLSEVYKSHEEPEPFAASSEPDFADTDEMPMKVMPAEDGSSDEYTASKDGYFAKDRSAAEIKSSVIDDSAAKRFPPPAPPMFAEDLHSVDIPIEDKPQGRREARHSAFLDQINVYDDGDTDDEPDEEAAYEEPRLRDQALKFARSCNSISQRLLPSSVIAIIMMLITFVHEAGLAVPFGIGRNLDYAVGALLILLLVVMMLCIEVLIRGVDFLISGNPNAESLILFSCVFSMISATFTMLSGTARMLPFCAVSALSLVFATFGERLNLRAMTDTLKTVISSADTYGVQAEYNENLDNSVLKKAYNRTDGFYLNLMQKDITEILYEYATPILLIGILLLTVINVLINGVIENSLHIQSALLAAAAPFSVLLSFPLPFGIIAKAVRTRGVALAGWGGVDDIAFTDGVCVTDDDLFPQGTLRLSAVKVYDGASPNNVMCYTASLVIASGSGLTGLFAQVIEQQGITPLRVASFECHESGISAIVQGHQVATGSAAHMNLIGVRVPDDSNMRNAIFTAVAGRLVAMFTVEYKPMPSIQNALIALLKWRIPLYFAMRDFNITPSMVGQKFKVPFESFVFMPVKESYSISDPYSGKHGRMASVLVREGLGPYADAITGGRLLRSATLFTAIVSIASAGLGVLFMFLMLWGGSFLSATPGNLILFMLSMLVSVFIVCGYVKLKS